MIYQKISLLFILIMTIVLHSQELLNVKEHTLNNGLKILIVEDHNIPVVTCRLYYKVGSVNENYGKTGISHMLEHMMFKGTKKIGVTDYKQEQKITNTIDSLFQLSDSSLFVGDTSLMKKYKSKAMEYVEKRRKYIKNNELWQLYQNQGATHLNAYTSKLLTAYTVTLPSNKLELFMWLESDRMANPVMREFYTERDVVMEERRLRYENSPYGRYYETLRSMIYEAHPYAIPTIGYMSDIIHYTKKDAMKHFKKYYIPNNSIMVLVGDVKKDHAVKLAKTYFEKIPKGKKIDEITTQDPRQSGQKRFIYEKDVKEKVSIYFKTPDIVNKDTYVLDLIASLLNGKSGRLYKTLVKNEKIASSAKAYNYSSKYNGYFFIEVDLIKEKSHKQAEKLVWQELNKLKDQLIKKREFQKVKNIVKSQHVNSFRSNEHIADMLAFLEVMYSWKWLNNYMDNIEKVINDQVKKTADRYFIQDNSIIGYVKNSGTKS